MSPIIFAIALLALVAGLAGSVLGIFAGALVAAAAPDRRAQKAGVAIAAFCAALYIALLAMLPELARA